jgi:hypothetical protein
MAIEENNRKSTRIPKFKTDNSVPTPILVQQSSAIPPIPPVIAELPKNKGQMKIKRMYFWMIVLIAIGGLYGCFHYYNKFKSLTADPNVEAQKMIIELVGVLGKLIELPSDETPTVATISEKDKLAGQVFFKNVENGDILFAYTNAMKAILYRPTTNKIVNVAPISIDQDQSIDAGTERGIQASPKSELNTDNKSNNR